jgi:predicted ATP-grasp superfamily ATP-dependent carboligase
LPAETSGHAIVLGDRDLGAPLHAAGIPATVACGPDSPNRFSRYFSASLSDPRPDEDALVETLLEDARTTPGPVVVYYQSDDDVLFVSRRRKELARRLRFVVADADLVESLVNKAAFNALARRMGLPVPSTDVLDLAGRAPDSHNISLPALVKPFRREDAWLTNFAAKALLVETPADAKALMDPAFPVHNQILVQQYIPGPETRIESYHSYIDTGGAVVAEFTGRKLRTFPNALGHSSAVLTTDTEDVASLGRSVLQALGLRGVAKVDFKRDPEGRLWLLEVNPRFTLWHRVGAAAGVNIPALVWADLVGRPRPPVGQARVGVGWCRVELDWRAMRERGSGVLDWLRWVARCETKAGVDPSDPVFLAAKALFMARSAARRALASVRR